MTPLSKSLLSLLRSKRSQSVRAILIILLALAVSEYFLNAPPPSAPPAPPPSAIPIVTPTPSPSAYSSPSSAPPADGASSQQASASPSYLVTHVRDGDTIEVNFGGKTEAVRFVGIDTPEFSSSSAVTKCKAASSAAVLRERILGTYVFLEPDATQADRDRYGRLLRFIYIADGTDIGAWLIEQGWAQEYLYSSKPHIHREEYLQKETLARKRNMGNWNSVHCQN